MCKPKGKHFTGHFRLLDLHFSPFVRRPFYNCMTLKYLCVSKIKKRLKMRKLITVFTLFFSAIIGANAQQITGVVKDAQGKGLEKATVSLLRGKDSSVVKLVVTGENGKYMVQAPQAGTYLVNASFVGFAPVYSQRFEIGTDAVNVPDLAISKTTGSLSDVTVTAKRPMVEVRADKTI